MFSGCTSLASVPRLPDEMVVASDYCYGMFMGCTNLSVNTESGEKIFTYPKDNVDLYFDEMFKNIKGKVTITVSKGKTYYYESSV